jgi:hypothetical protein
MKIVLAPDSFKECLTAAQVARAMAQAVYQVYPSAEVIPLPLADGGEGTLDVLVPALEASLREVTVSDPLGRPVRARYGVAGETAIIEVAQACGLSLLRPQERQPLIASSRGVGELLMAACAAGCPDALVRRLAECIRANGLDTHCPYPADALTAAAMGDKKRAGGTITLVLPEKIGRCYLKKIPVNELRDHFERAIMRMEALGL